MIFKYLENGNGIKSIFSGIGSAKNGLTSNDIDNIKKSLIQYNAELDKGVTTQTAYMRTLENAHPIAQKLAEDANGQRVSLEGVEKAATGATGSMGGTKIATAALNMAISFGLSIAVQGLISLFQKLKSKNNQFLLIINF